VARADGPEAIRRLALVADRLAPVTLVTELRTVAADPHWLSSAYRRDSLAIHFTWKPDWPAVRALLPAVERALEPFEPRPHWGKLFRLPPEHVRELYPERLRFIELAHRLDPEGVFRNAFVDAFVFGGA
jgi:xylitol oxidase